MTEEEKIEKVEKSKVKPITVVSSIVIIMVIALTFFSVLIYGFGVQSNLIKTVTRPVPLPLASVGGFNFITIREVEENLMSVKKFYESQDFASIGVRIDFTTEEGKKRLKVKERDVINKMIEDEAIENLAKERGIVITKKMVEESVERKIKEIGSGEGVDENLMQLYGWTIEDFEHKVVMPGIYKTELEKNVLGNDLKDNTQKAKDSIEKIQKRLNEGEDFSEIVSQNSSENDEKRNGSLGWFEKEQLNQDLQEKVFSLGKGEISDIIESDLGFHIVKVIDKKIEDEKEMIEIAQIFVSKKTFGEWLEDEMKKMEIRVFVKGYRWNKEEAICEFDE
ncbi:MAG: peptidylprolyl isomerase [Candidatus Moranbacteria bacterium]|nr:peptidylprolyl isomerase [Candidatus Moranbacteria bacterium]